MLCTNKFHRYQISIYSYKTVFPKHVYALRSNSFTDILIIDREMLSNLHARNLSCEKHVREREIFLEKKKKLARFITRGEGISSFNSMAQCKNSSNLLLITPSSPS